MKEVYNLTLFIIFIITRIISSDIYLNPNHSLKNTSIHSTKTNNFIYDSKSIYYRQNLSSILYSDKKTPLSETSF